MSVTPWSEEREREVRARAVELRRNPGLDWSHATTLETMLEALATLDQVRAELKDAKAARAWLGQELVIVAEQAAVAVRNERQATDMVAALTEADTKLRARVQALERALGEAAVVMERAAEDHPWDWKDHACAECVPGGEIVKDGFQCARHAARALAPRRPEGQA